MALYFKEQTGEGSPTLPEIFKSKRFRSYVDMANFADKHKLPDGKYWIRNTQGKNVLTMMRELTRKGSSFRVEGKGNI